MSECDWAFGVCHEEHVDHPRYMRFARWSDDTHLVRPWRDWTRYSSAKTAFAFSYMPSRRPIAKPSFGALSRYKHVDAPGRSMNNMPSIDPVPGQIDWNAKRAFLRQYQIRRRFRELLGARLQHRKADARDRGGQPADLLGRSRDRPVLQHRALHQRARLSAKPRRLLPRLPYAAHSTSNGAAPTFLQKVVVASTVMRANSSSASGQRRI